MLTTSGRPAPTAKVHVRMPPSMNTSPNAKSRSFAVAQIKDRPMATSA